MSQALAGAYLCLVVSLQPCMVPLKYSLWYPRISAAGIPDVSGVPSL